MRVQFEIPRWLVESIAWLIIVLVATHVFTSVIELIEALLTSAP